jgi:cysteinyl-tRNA synthetase
VILTDKVTREKSTGFCAGKKQEITYHALAFTMVDGFQGWHLECTAMSTKYLEQSF